MLNEGVKAQHTKKYVSISLSEEQCKIYQSEQFFIMDIKEIIKRLDTLGRCR